jgi:hypothetical protein
MDNLTTSELIKQRALIRRELSRRKRKEIRRKARVPAKLNIVKPNTCLDTDEFNESMKRFFYSTFRTNLVNTPEFDVPSDADDSIVIKAAEKLQSFIDEVKTLHIKTTRDDNSVIVHAGPANQTLSVIVEAAKFLRVCLLQNVKLVDNARRRGRCCFLATRLYGPECLHQSKLNKNTFAKNDFTYPAFLAQLFTIWFPNHRMLDELESLRHDELDFTNELPNVTAMTTDEGL